jgi:2-oxo-4-hydroxy-4-carboxy--5-ureidoimidazoline (OHCU) decarboxylase
MIRLRRRDFQDHGVLLKLAEVAKMEVEEFVKRFGPVVESDPAEGA